MYFASKANYSFKPTPVGSAGARPRWHPFWPSPNDLGPHDRTMGSLWAAESASPRAQCTYRWLVVIWAWPSAAEGGERPESVAQPVGA